MNNTKKYETALKVSALALMTFISRVSSNYGASYFNKSNDKTKYAQEMLAGSQSANSEDSKSIDTLIFSVDEFKDVSKKMPENVEKIMVKKLYNPEYIFSLADYQPEPLEAAFDKALSKVLKERNKTPIICANSKKDSSIIDYFTIKASAWQESRFDKKIMSSKGAAGYMQLMEGTYLSFRPHDKFPYDALVAEKNIDAGIRYYEYLLDEISRKYPKADVAAADKIRNMAIAAYNGGQGALQNAQWKIELMPSESRNHVKAVSEKRKEYLEMATLVKYAKDARKSSELYSKLRHAIKKYN